MTPTLATFMRALLTPESSFATLAGLRAVAGSDGLPVLRRTTRFVEAEILLHDARWLLSMPLNTAAAARIERTASRLGRMRAPWLAPYRLLPAELRWSDAAFGAGHDADATAFEALRERVAPCASAPLEMHDVAADYDALPAELTGHLWASHTFEGLICVEDETGYGFVDTHNRTVIPARFRWAGDFREGRAEVETDTGMGLIDRTGAYILPPEYEIVDYDPAESRIRVRRDGKWATFDYTGRRLTPFA